MNTQQQSVILKPFRRSDFPTAAVSKAPLVSMTIKDGKIQFNEPASRLLGIVSGDYLELGQDEENPRRLWFRKGGREDGFEVHSRGPKRNVKVLCIISKPLLRHIQQTLNTEYNISFQLGTESQYGAFWALESSFRFTKPRTLLRK